MIINFAIVLCRPPGSAWSLASNAIFQSVLQSFLQRSWISTDAERRFVAVYAKCRPKRQPGFASPVESPYTRPVSYTIRDVRDDELDAVLSLNEASIPAVNSISIGQMRWFREHAAYFRVGVDDDRLGAFLIGMRPGTGYDSLNYTWFCKHYDDFGYIDRIAVADHARRLGLATRLYDDFRSTLPDTVDVMTCEVNLKPPNESSMAFHRRLGFTQVGTQETEGGTKQVALLEKKL